jgi:SAM-dependent methyltransferase
VSDRTEYGGFEVSYQGPPAPWDIGRPQPVIVDFAARGLIADPVLDAGCGTGENALYLSSLGLDVTGLDGAPTAIARARAKALERGLTATFVLGDALRLEALERVFATVVDCGLFHVFPDAERARYVAGLGAIVAAGGRLHILCFSDRQPGTRGPRRISEAELRTAFATGWLVDEIARTHFATNDQGPPVKAWRASFSRV